MPMPMLGFPWKVSAPCCTFLLRHKSETRLLVRSSSLYSVVQILQPKWVIEMYPISHLLLLLLRFPFLLSLSILHSQPTNISRWDLLIKKNKKTWKLNLFLTLSSSTVYSYWLVWLYALPGTSRNWRLSGGRERSCPCILSWPTSMLQLFIFPFIFSVKCAMFLFLVAKHGTVYVSICVDEVWRKNSRNEVLRFLLDQELWTQCNGDYVVTVYILYHCWFKWDNKSGIILLIVWIPFCLSVKQYLDFQFRLTVLSVEGMNKLIQLVRLLQVQRCLYLNVWWGCNYLSLALHSFFFIKSRPP